MTRRSFLSAFLPFLPAGLRNHYQPLGFVDVERQIGYPPGTRSWDHYICDAHTGKPILNQHYVVCAHDVEGWYVQWVRAGDSEFGDYVLFHHPVQIRAKALRYPAK